MKSKKFVAYYRVSTKKQGQSGLGLDAQKATVAAYARDKGQIEREFVEVESGKKNTRPQLQEAIEYCRLHGCTLVIAKLDRLARSVSFIFALREAGIDFACADMPDLNTLTLGIFASLAQYEAELISKRTKEALAAKKAQGFHLGTPGNLTKEARDKGHRQRRKHAQTQTANKKAYALAKEMREKGSALRTIADCLNNAGIPTTRGNKWYSSTVKNLLSLFA